MLLGENDVEPERLRTHVVRAAIGGLHDPRAAARRDQEVPLTVPLARGGDDPRELAGDVVVRGVGDHALGDADGLLGGGVAGAMVAEAARFVELLSGGRRILDPRAPEHDDRRADAGLALQHLGLHQLEHQPDRPQILTFQEQEVFEGHDEARVLVVVVHGVHFPSASAASTTPR